MTLPSQEMAGMLQLSAAPVPIVVQVTSKVGGGDPMTLAFVILGGLPQVCASTVASSIQSGIKLRQYTTHSAKCDTSKSNVL